MTGVYLPPGHQGPLDVGLIDPEEVGVFGFNWADWLTKNNLANVDESTWSVSTGAALGDGVTTVDKKGLVATPGAPTLASPQTTCHVYVNGAAAGDTITITNHIRASSLLADRSMIVTVSER